LDDDDAQRDVVLSYISRQYAKFNAVETWKPTPKMLNQIYLILVLMLNQIFLILILILFNQKFSPIHVLVVHPGCTI